MIWKDASFSLICYLQWCWTEQKG